MYTKQDELTFMLTLQKELAARGLQMTPEQKDRLTKIQEELGQSVALSGECTALARPLPTYIVQNRPEGLAGVVDIVSTQLRSNPWLAVAAGAAGAYFLKQWWDAKKLRANPYPADDGDEWEYDEDEGEGEDEDEEYEGEEDEDEDEEYPQTKKKKHPWTSEDEEEFDENDFEEDDYDE